VRRLLPLLLVVLGLAACGGSSTGNTSDLVSARERTTAAGTAGFTMTITLDLAGTTVRAQESGAISFTKREAHLYKLLPGGGLPQELVFVGPYTYTNANIQAAMNDSSVRPWTKLDTRRLTAKQRSQQPDELAHVRALAYLADGVADAKVIGKELVAETKTTHFSGTVDPARLVARVPAAVRGSIRTAIRNDYASKPFPGEFWLDEQGRVARVRVDYRTPKGTKITVDGGFLNFGDPVDLTVPDARSIVDITP
jgi:hypothetical protein